MKLYYMTGACSLASHIALVWAKASYVLKPLSHVEVASEPYLQINPKGAVPVLVLDDGTVLTESLAVLEYIADRYPAQRLGAEQGDTLARAQLNESLAEMVSDVHKAWSPVFVPDRYVTDPRNENEARQAAFGQLALQYSHLNRRMEGKQWRLFDRRTVADAYLYVMCSWVDKTPTPLSAYPALASYKARLQDDAGVQRAIREESENAAKIKPESAASIRA